MTLQLLWQLLHSLFTHSTLPVPGSVMWIDVIFQALWYWCLPVADVACLHTLQALLGYYFAFALWLPEGDWWTFFRWFDQWQRRAKPLDSRDVRFWCHFRMGPPKNIFHYHTLLPSSHSRRQLYYSQLRLRRRLRVARCRARHKSDMALHQRCARLKRTRRRTGSARRPRPRRSKERNEVSQLAVAPRPDLTKDQRQFERDWLQAYEDAACPRELEPTPSCELGMSYPMSLVEAMLRELDPLHWIEQFRLVQGPLLVSGSEAVDVTKCFRAEATVLDELRCERAPHASRGAYNATGRTGTSKQTPIVIDTGCSLSLTPHLEDFVTDLREATVTEMKGIGNTVAVNGIGTAEWAVRDIFGRIAVIRTECYHVPSADIRLFSPQTYFQEHDGGDCVVSKDKVTIRFKDGSEAEFPYNHGSNLPLMLEDWSVCHGGLTAYNVYEVKAKDLIRSARGLLDDTNTNLNGAQKELLLWHYRLCHAGMTLLQSLMLPVKVAIGELAEPPLIPSRVSTSHKCALPQCPACQLAKQHRKTPDNQVTHTKSETEMAIRRGNLEPGECFSMDQYDSPIRGRLPHTRGKEPVEDRYRGGTIYVDHASGFVFLYHQISLRIGETLQGKHALESFANQFGIKIKSYRGDNHPFAAKEMREDLELQGQDITFSGVGAHFQNGVAERAVQTITQSARAMMMHQLIHWPKAFDASLWPFAMNQAVMLWNHLPRNRGGLSPIELFTGTKLPHNGVIQRARVWGCPVYVLDPRLQDGKKLPKWNRRSRMGVNLGYSPTHSDTVGLVLNPVTGYISPQYHVVYDELYTTVPGEFDQDLFDDEHWDTLLMNGGLVREVPVLEQSENQIPFAEHFDQFVDLPESAVPEGDDSEDDDDETSDSDSDSKTDDEPPPVRTRSGRIVKPPPAFAHLSVGTYMGRTPKQTKESVPRSELLRYEAGGNPNQKIKNRDLLNQQVHGLDWSLFVESLRNRDTKCNLLSMLNSIDPIQGTVEEWNPMALAMKFHDEDNPSWEMAMNGPNADGFWRAAKQELDTLTKMRVWDIVPRKSWMNVLPSTWAFKIKRLPDGDVKKLKARFCARGDKQIHGVDFFETYAPVVNWNTVRLLLILTAQLGLATQQVDYTAAFVHAEIDKPPNFDEMSPEEQRRQGVYVEMPRGFAQAGKVLKLRKSLYGLRQSPKNWFLHLSQKLEAVGLKPATHIDPCLLVTSDPNEPPVICLVYVDDTLLYAEKDEHINRILEKLRNEHGMKLEKEDDVAGFLGVHLNKDPHKGTITLTQTGLAERIVEALHCKDLPPVSTPATEVLGKDEFGDPANCTFNYASVVGVLWYLYGHSRPDLGFAVSQAARFAFQPKRSHELALIRIGQYLNSTLDKGIIMKPIPPTGKFTMDAYVDSDFMGLYGKEDRADPTNVKSRTGFVICLNGCPIIWASKLQESVALSTMMAEYYALSTCMREVIPLRETVKAVAEGLGISHMCETSFLTTVWEDNMGAWTLANLEPGQSTPRSKFYDVKVHWFREHLTKGVMEVLKIDTEEQLADLFTKPLVEAIFVRLRKKLMGW